MPRTVRGSCQADSAERHRASAQLNRRVSARANRLRINGLKKADSISLRHARRRLFCRRFAFYRAPLARPVPTVPRTAEASLSSFFPSRQPASPGGIRPVKWCRALCVRSGHSHWARFGSRTAACDQWAAVRTASGAAPPIWGWASGSLEGEVVTGCGLKRSCRDPNGAMTGPATRRDSRKAATKSRGCRAIQERIPASRGFSSDSTGAASIRRAPMPRA